MITQVESFGEVLESGQAGDNVGCLLRKTAHDQVEKGQVLAATGSLTPHREFEAEVYVLKKEEGGRHTPFFDGYAPQFFFRTTNVTGSTSVMGGVQMAMPGDGVQLKVSLLQPVADQRRRPLRNPRRRQDRRFRRRHESARLNNRNALGRNIDQGRFSFALPCCRWPANVE